MKRYAADQQLGGMVLLAGLFHGLFGIAHIGRAAEAASGGLFKNSDFGRGVATEVLWDGVDSKGNLRVPSGSRMCATAKGEVRAVPMPASVSIGDVTGDQLPDLVVGDSVGYIWVFPNSGTPQEPRFTSGEILPVWLYDHGRWGGYQIHDNWTRSNARYVPRVHVTDWDGNREPELVVGTFYGEIYRVSLSVSGGKISIPNSGLRDCEISMRQQGEFWGNLFTPFVWDWNGDGAKDLILGEGTYGCNAIYLLANVGANSNPRFAPEKRNVILWGDGREQLKPVVVDWDNDGSADIVVADSRGEISVHFNRKGPKGVAELAGEGMPITIGSKKALGEMCSPAVGDLNGDGLFDLVLGKTDGTIGVSYNTGKIGVPRFEKFLGLTGVDLITATQWPVYWSGDHLRPGVPYCIVEQTDDATNVAAAGRSGGKCLRLYYAKPRQSAVATAFPRIATDIKEFRNILRYEPGLPLVIGAKYEISFWARRSGFDECEWYAWGNEYKEAKTRRGERQVYGLKRLTHHEIRESIPSGDWRLIRKVFTLPGQQKGKNMGHQFWLMADGSGELAIDDVTCTLVKGMDAPAPATGAPKSK